MFVTKAPLRQRQALSAMQVRALENYVTSGECLQDRLFAGFLLVCLYTRARYGDAMSIETMELDRDGDHGGFLQTSTGHTKTGTSKERRSQMLPMAAPLRGLLGDQWAPAFMELRLQAGLITGSGKPFMPAPALDGGWTQRALSSGEASGWLKELLVRLGVGAGDLSGIGTHSLKVTTLSWCAKFGILAEDRKSSVTIPQVLNPAFSAIAEMHKHPPSVAYREFLMRLGLVRFSLILLAQDTLGLLGWKGNGICLQTRR